MDKTFFRQRVPLSMMNNLSAFTQLDYSSKIHYFCTAIKIGKFLNLIQSLSFYYTRLFQTLRSAIDTYPFRLWSIPENSLLSYKGWNDIIHVLK